jgi:hypothetical protein
MSEELENNDHEMDTVDQNVEIKELLKENATEAVIKENVLQLLKDKYSNAGLIAIKPYSNPNAENMGLENHGYVVHPGTHQVATMACIMYRGKKRYMNGLDEFAPEVKAIVEDDKRNARIREIRTIVAELELEKTYNKIDIEDNDFWNKVETFRPDNSDVWSNMRMECGNNEIFLNPASNSDHLLMILAIEAGGFPDIAKSYEDIKNSRRGQKWYLDKQVDNVESKTNVNKIKNKALAKLDAISDEKPQKLFYVAKLIQKNSIQYKNKTLEGQIYDDLDNYINGRGFEPSIKKSSNQFLTLATTDMKELKIRSIIKDANIYNMLITKGDSLIYDADSGIMLGRNIAEVYEKLANPANIEILNNLMDKVESRW